MSRMVLGSRAPLPNLKPLQVMTVAAADSVDAYRRGRRGTPGKSSCAWFVAPTIRPVERSQLDVPQTRAALATTNAFPSTSANSRRSSSVRKPPNGTTSPFDVSARCVLPSTCSENRTRTQ